MNRIETFLALAAVVLASLSALHTPLRLPLALAAIMLLTYICSRRLRAMLKNKTTKPSGFDPYERAMRIREERHRRLDR